MSFFVAALALFQLLFEAAALLLGVVEFAEAVGKLHLSRENFETLDPIGFVGLVLGERRDHGGELVDHRWLDQVLFRNGLKQIGDRLSCRLVGIVRHVRMNLVEPLN